jgi:hypothetical protein
MNFLKRYSEQFAEAEEKIAREKRAAREASFQRHIDRLNQQIDEMASRHCPLVGKNCILGSCVHFSPGWVTQYDEDVMATEPRCKLWGVK